MILSVRNAPDSFGLSAIIDVPAGELLRSRNGDDERLNRRRTRHIGGVSETASTELVVVYMAITNVVLVAGSRMDSQ